MHREEEPACKARTHLLLMHCLSILALNPPLWFPLNSQPVWYLFQLILCFTATSSQRRKEQNQKLLGKQSSKLHPSKNLFLHIPAGSPGPPESTRSLSACPPQSPLRSGSAIRFLEGGWGLSFWAPWRASG